MRLSARLTAFALPLLLAACNASPPPANDLDALDAELTEGAANGRDPVAAAALQDQIMVDPQLASRSNADAIRPPAQPYAAPVPAADVAPGKDDEDGATRSAPAPSGTCRDCAAARQALTLGALAARQRTPLGGNCVGKLAYGAGWSNRLPTDLPLHSEARVTEAAGTADDGCSLRVVSFTVARPMQAVLDWYYTRATKAGYSAGHQADDAGEHVLGGARRRDGAAYMLFLSDRPGGGTDVDIVANNGR